MSVQAKNPNKSKGRRNTSTLTGLMPLITLAVLVLVMTIGTRRFFTLSNITGMVEQGSTLLVMGLGQTFIILLGSIDLSIAAVAALVTIITAMLIPSLGYLAFPVALLCGAWRGPSDRPGRYEGQDPFLCGQPGRDGPLDGGGLHPLEGDADHGITGQLPLLKWVSGATGGIPNVIFTAMACGDLLHPGRVHALRPLRQSHRRR